MKVKFTTTLASILLLLVELVVCPEWIVKDIGSKGTVFSISSPIVKGEPVLQTIADNLIISLDSVPQTSYTTQTSVLSDSIEITVFPKVSIETTKLQVTIPAVPSFNLTPSTYLPLSAKSVQVTFLSYIVPNSNNQIAKYVTLALKMITTISGTVIMINSAFKLNGLLLLKFSQMMDLINSFALLNLNYREVIRGTLSSIYAVSQNSFMFIPVPITFSDVKNKYTKTRGRLTELEVSPLLLENQFVETCLLILTFSASFLLFKARVGKWTKKLSNLISSIRFGIVELFLVEQFFYSAYQLLYGPGLANMKLQENILSYISAVFSIGIIFHTVFKIILYTRQENFYSIENQLIRDNLVPEASSNAKVSPSELEEAMESIEADLAKLDYPSYLREFIEADMHVPNLKYLSHRLYNPFFTLRLILQSLILLVCQNYTLLQFGLIGAVNIFMLCFTLSKAFGDTKYFSSFWVSLQRCSQEILINLMFGTFYLFCFDSKVMQVLSVDACYYLSLIFIAACGLSLASELVFLIINLIRSVLNFIMNIGKICKKKKLLSPNSRKSRKAKVIGSSVCDSSPRFISTLREQHQKADLGASGLTSTPMNKSTNNSGFSNYAKGSFKGDRPLNLVSPASPSNVMNKHRNSISGRPNKKGAVQEGAFPLRRTSTPGVGTAPTDRVSPEKSGQLNYEKLKKLHYWQLI